MKMTDQQIKQVVIQAVQSIDNASFPEDVHTISPEFQKKMDALLTQQRRRRHARTAIRTIAACLAVAIVCTITWLNSDIKAKATATYWLQQNTHSGSFKYIFQDIDSMAPMQEYTIAKLPSGYEEVLFAAEETHHLRMYSNGFQTLFFKYCQMIEKESISLNTFYKENGYTSYPVKIGELEGACYSARNASRANIVVWMEPEGGYVFILSGPISTEQLAEIAKNVRTVNP